MILHRKIGLEFAHRKVNLADEEYFQPPDSLVTLTTVAGSGGTVSPATQNYKRDEYVALVATPNAGNSFYRWLIDGAEKLDALITVKMTKSKTAIAEFIQSVAKQILTITSVGYGSINPDCGSYEYNEDEIVTITATPQDTGFDKTDSYFEEFDVNGVSITDNPLNLTMNEAKSVEAMFKLWNIDNLCFNSVPENNSFRNTGAGKDVAISNVRVGIFTTSTYINSSIYNVGGEPIDLTIDFYISGAGSGTTRTLYRSSGSGGRGFSIFHATTNYIQIQQYSGGSTMTMNTLVPHVGWWRIKLTWNCQTGGTMLVVFTNISLPSSLSYSNSGTFGWTGNSTEVIKCGAVSNSWNSYVARVTLANKFDWILNHGQGTTIFDCLGLGNNGTVTGANLTTFWGSTANGVDAYDLTLGATLYEADVVYLSGELITNGSFDNGGAGWTPSYQCSVNNGYGHIYTADGSSQTISQIISGFVALNKHFLLEFDIIENVIGGLTVQFNGSTYSVNISGVGHKKIYLTSTYNSTIALYFNRQTGVAGVQNVKIDNISLRETLNQYTVDDGSIMPICYNKPEEITGFTRLGWFPSGSGILKGLPNLYNINGVDRDFAYLKALPTSEYLIKTETENNISYYKERFKATELIDSDGNIIRVLNNFILEVRG